MGWCAIQNLFTAIDCFAIKSGSFSLALEICVETLIKHKKPRRPNMQMWNQTFLYKGVHIPCDRRKYNLSWTSGGFRKSTFLRQWKYANTNVHVFQVLEKEFVFLLCSVLLRSTDPIVTEKSGTSTCPQHSRNNLPRISQMRNKHWIAKNALVQPMVASCMWQMDTRNIHINTWGARSNVGSSFATNCFSFEWKSHDGTRQRTSWQKTPNATKHYNEHAIMQQRMTNTQKELSLNAKTTKTTHTNMLTTVI